MLFRSTVYSTTTQRHITSTNPLSFSPYDSHSGIIEAILQPNTKCLVKQKMEEWEMISGWETENAYQLKFGNGYRGFAKEESNLAHRQFLGSSRPFRMKVFVAHPHNKTVTPLLVIKRPYKIIGGELEVRDSNKNVIGHVKKRFSVTSRKFIVTDHSGRECYSLRASHVIGKCFSIYDSKTSGKTEVGRIKKQWSGLLQEMYSDADNFGVEFPPGSTSQEKALLLAATFIIDFLFFENNNKFQF